MVKRYQHPPDIVWAQNQKKLFDASADPRNYTTTEIERMSAELIRIWENGSYRTAKVEGTNFNGKYL